MNTSVQLRLGRWLLGGMVFFWFVFLLLPMVIVVVAAFTSADYLIFPPPGFSLRWFQEALGLDWFRYSLITSLWLALFSTLATVVLGILAARVLSRHRFRGRALLEYIFLSSLIVPAVVIGFALLNFFSAIEGRAPFGNLLVGHVLVTLPFTIRAIWASMAGLDRSLEEAAYSLGATPWTTFWQVILPLIRPGIVAGAILAFTYSFNDVAISLFLVGPGITTLPVEMMSHIAYSADPTPAAISAIMIGITLLFFVLAEWTVGLGIFAETST